MFTVNHGKRLIAICEGRILPETLEELCCYNAYTMRISGNDMETCILEMDPAIEKMDLEQIRHFIYGIAFAERMQVIFEQDFELDDKDSNIH